MKRVRGLSFKRVLRLLLCLAACANPGTGMAGQPPASASADAGSAPPRPLAFLRVELGPAPARRLVQQQILYIARLFYRVPLMAGSFSPPRADHAVVEPLGDMRRYRTTLEGQRYRVAEQRYAIFPQRSGRLDIQPAGFSAVTSISGQGRLHSREQAAIRMMLQSRGGRGGRLFGQEETLRMEVRGRPLSLNIAPRPAAYRGTEWLPAQDMMLRDSWTEQTPQLRVGEPLVRTLTLEARGLDASQLPELELPESPRLRVYPQSPELSNGSDGDWIIGRSQRRFTYVATRAGHHVLPALRIHWWDAAQGRQRELVLPQRKIEVVAVSAPAAGTRAPPPPAAAPPAPAGIGVSLALLGILLVLALAVGCRRRGGCALPWRPGLRVLSSRFSRPRQQLKAACRHNRSHQAAAALRALAAQLWPEHPPAGLGELAQRLERLGQPQAASAVRELETRLYGAEGERGAGWDGQRLWSCLSHLSRRRVRGRRRKVPWRSGGEDILPPLYPGRG